MPTFMSRQPPVVLTLAASTWNSTSPAAAANASAEGRRDDRKAATRVASAWQARRIVSSLTFQPQHSASSRSATAKEFCPPSRQISRVACRVRKPSRPRRRSAKVAPRAAGPAGEGGPPEDHGPECGHHRLGRISLVSAGRPAGAGAGGAPFFSRASARDWRVDSKTLLRKSRPLPSKKDSQRSMTWPSGAESGRGLQLLGQDEGLLDDSPLGRREAVEIVRQHGCSHPRGANSSERASLITASQARCQNRLRAPRKCKSASATQNSIAVERGA